jgi:D-alanyl-D-alanine carboxypeptidase (penicillin-binding protein 5/6)
VSVVLGTSSEAARDADSLALLRYGVAQFRRVHPVVEGRSYGSAKVRYYDGRTVGLVAAQDAKLTVRRGRPVRRRVMAPDELEGPIAAGERVGSIQVLARGRVVRTIPLVTQERVEEAGFVRKATAPVGGAAVAVALLVLLAVCALLALRMRARRKSPGGTASNDHHRHAERRDRQDARGTELPPRAPPPGG